MSLIIRIFKWLFCAGSSSRRSNPHRQPKRIVVESRDGRKTFRINEYGEVFPED